MTHPQVVVAVPARLESARLPGKLLAEIAGKPMLQHVLERCQQARGVAAVLVCTDSEQVRHLAQAWGVSVLMTSPDCSSGSERLASVVAELVAAAGGAASDFDETLVINVQGDQPLLDPGVIEAMVAQFELLQRPPLVAIGLLSYSLYLWHWSVFSLARWSVGVSAATLPWLLALTVVLAWLSWKLLEEPLRRRPWSDGPARAARASLPPGSS